MASENGKKTQDEKYREAQTPHVANKNKTDKLKSN